MYKKIYFNEKALLLCDGEDEIVKKYKGLKDVLYINDAKDNWVQVVIDVLKNRSIQTVVVTNNNAEKLLETFKSKVVFIQAAGGYIFFENEVLLIFRRGKWDLPKGKLDDGEVLATAALREVEEETGLQNVSIIEPLCITYHTYYQDGDFILKESHWYMMQAHEKQDLTPQIEEDIEICEWVDQNHLADYLKNTHPSIADVIAIGVEKQKTIKV